MIGYKCIVRDGGFSYYMGQNTIRSAGSFIVREAGTAKTRNIPEYRTSLTVAYFTHKTGKIDYKVDAGELSQKVREAIELYARPD